MDRDAASREFRLVAPGSDRGLTRRLEETQSSQERAGRLAVFRPNSPLDFGHVDATRPQEVTIGKEVEEAVRHGSVATHVSDEHGRIE
jgi:hypothetical protein